MLLQSLLNLHAFVQTHQTYRGESENQSYACEYVLLILSLTGVYEYSKESVADGFLHQFRGYCTIDTARDGPNL